MNNAPRVYLYIPYNTDASVLIPNIEGNYESLLVNNEPFVSNETVIYFTSNVSIKIVNQKDQKEYTVNVNVYTGFPIVNINTNKSKIYMPLILDHDWSIGYTHSSLSPNVLSPEGFCMNEKFYPYMSYLIDDPMFKKEVKKHREGVENLPLLFDYINSTAQTIKFSASANFEVWNIYNLTGVTLMEHWENEVQYLKTVLSDRQKWLNNETSR